MFTYIDLRKTSEHTDNREMACLDEISRMMDQVVEVFTTTHNGLKDLSKSIKPIYNTWDLFKKTTDSSSSLARNKSFSPLY